VPLPTLPTLLLLPARLIAARHCGTGRHGAAAASSTHGWVPEHPWALWARVMPAAQDLTCRRSSLRTSVFSALQDKKEHKALANGPAHAVAPGMAERVFPSGCSSDLRLSGPTSHRLISHISKGWSSFVAHHERATSQANLGSCPDLLLIFPLPPAKQGC